MTVKTIENVIKLKNGKDLKIRPLDACRLMIDTYHIAFLDVEKDDNSNVVSVAFEGQQTIKIGQEVKLPIGNVISVYKIVAIIVEKNHKNIILFSTLPNKTNTFLLPMLNKTKLQLKIDSYFSNAYISENKEFICLLYRYTGSNLYKVFEETMITEKLCVKHLEYDKYHVMFLFKIPNEFKQDVEYFFEGKYSKFSEKLKTMICKFYTKGEKESIISQILYKSPKLQKLIELDLEVYLSNEAELASKPIYEQEIYKLQL